VRPSLGLRAARAGVLALLAGLMLLGGAAPAQGHALLRRSDPAEDVRLDETPSAVTLEFTEPPELSLSDIQVLDQSGAEVHQGEAALVAGDDQGLQVVVVPQLEEGVYTVVWRVVSKVDGHPTGGTFAFGVGVSPLQVADRPVVEAPEVPEASPLEAGGRWGLFVGLGLLLGASWIGVLAFREVPRPLLRMAVVACLVALGGLVALALAQRSAANVSLGDLSSTDVGRALVWRGAGLLGASAMVLVALAPGRWRRTALGVAAVLAAGVMLVHVEAGHAAAVGGSGRWARILVQWAHFAAAGVWLGGLAALLLGVRGQPSEIKAVAVRRFSRVAAFGLAAVAVTGAVRALNEVGSWEGLFSTGYGQIVLLKTGLLLVVAGLGAVNRYRNVPVARRSLRGLRRVGGTEVALGAVVLGAAALLATLVPPASVPALERPPAALTVTGSDFATSVRARLEVDPAIPGPNRFLLRLTDFDTGEPVAADAVQLRFEAVGASGVGESTLELKPEDEGVYQAVGANLAVGGPWEVTALVQRGGDAVEVPLQLATVCETTAIPGPADQFTIDVVELPDGSTVQGYVLEVGRGEVHFTFLDPRGRSVPLQGEPTFIASGPQETLSLDARSLGGSHFAARAPLTPGEWRFDGLARTAEGALLSGCLEETVPS
jgi:copper transport protein